MLPQPRLPIAATSPWPAAPWHLSDLLIHNRPGLRGARGHGRRRARDHHQNGRRRSHTLVAAAVRIPLAARVGRGARCSPALRSWHLRCVKPRDRLPIPVCQTPDPRPALTPRLSSPAMPPPAELSAYGSILVSPILISQIADTISPAAAGPPCLFGRAVYRTGRAPAVLSFPSANRATKQCLRRSLALVMLTSGLGTLAAPTPSPLPLSLPILATAIAYPRTSDIGRMHAWPSRAATPGHAGPPV